jgi:hypothetical protein
VSEVFVDTFASFGRMEVLRLGANRLRSLPPGAFKHNPQLRTLDLSGNLLE